MTKSLRRTSGSSSVSRAARRSHSPSDAHIIHSCSSGSSAATEVDEELRSCPRWSWTRRARRRRCPRRRAERKDALRCDKERSTCGERCVAESLVESTWPPPPPPNTSLSSKVKLFLKQWTCCDSSAAKACLGIPGDAEPGVVPSRTNTEPSPAAGSGEAPITVIVGGSLRAHLSPLGGLDIAGS